TAAGESRGVADGAVRVASPHSKDAPEMLPRFSDTWRSTSGKRLRMTNPTTTVKPDRDHPTLAQLENPPPRFAAPFPGEHLSKIETARFSGHASHPYGGAVFYGASFPGVAR